MISITSVLPSLAQVTIALAATAAYFVLAALSYVVGVVGYYAGRENAATSITANKATLKETQKPIIQHGADKVDSLWSFAIGTLVTFAVLVLLIGLGIMNTTDMLIGIFMPIVYSIVAGSIVGLIALLLIDKINES
jgi:ABC-type polysaccharide/polyol phosphate export permease